MMIAQQLENKIASLRTQNQSAAVSLQLQIAALQQQGYEAYQKWLLDNRKVVLDEKEHDAEYAPRKSSGSSSSGSSSSGWMFSRFTSISVSRTESSLAMMRLARGAIFSGS